MIVLCQALRQSGCDSCDSAVPSVSHVMILLRIASSDFGHEWRLCLSASTQQLSLELARAIKK